MTKANIAILRFFLYITVKVRKHSYHRFPIKRDKLLSEETLIADFNLSFFYSVDSTEVHEIFNN